MTTTLPKPFSAYVGLLASTVGGAADTVRHPSSVARLPLLAVSSLLMARERYDEMAERGELVLQGVLSHFGGSPSAEARRGSGMKSTFDQVQGRTAARVADAGDNLEERAGAVVTRLHDAAEQATRAGQRVVGGPGTPLGTGARAAAGAAGRAAEKVERAADVVRPPSPVESMSAEVAAPPTLDRGAIDDLEPAGGPNPAESGPLRTVGHAVAAEVEQAVAAATSTPDPLASMSAEPAAPPTTSPGPGGDAPVPPAVRKQAAKAARKAAKKATAPAKKAVPAKKATAQKATAQNTAAQDTAAQKAVAQQATAAPSAPAPAQTPALTQTPRPAVPAPAPAKAAAPVKAVAPTKAAAPAKAATPTPPAPAATSAGTDAPVRDAATASPVTSAPAPGPAAAAPATPAATPAAPEAPAVPSGHTDGLEVPPAVREAAGPLRSHDELPLGDFDHMTMGSLRGRLRTLEAPALVQLLDYEQAHAARLPILTLLQNRLRKVLAD